MSARIYGTTGHRGAASGDVDFIVVGGGIIGAAMAALLVARGVADKGRVAVIAEQPAAPSGSIAWAGSNAASDFDWDLRVFALSRASQRVLELGGAWRALREAKRCAYERMCVWEARDGQAVDGGAFGWGSLTFDCAAIGEPNLGFIVEGRALQSACMEAAASAGVVFIDAALENIEVGDAGVRVRLDDGRELTSGLLIGADGIDSTTRRLMNIGTAGHGYHQDALVAHVRTEKPHRSTAWQRFLPTGPLAFLPLPDGRSSVVWSAARGEARRLRALDAAAFGAALTAASSAVLGACELTTAVASFPLQLQYALRYVGPRCVLVGDAAHTVHPLAGQGLNLGLLDCASLVDVLGAAGFTGDSRVLRRYERWRRAENLLAATALDGLERLFASDNALIGRLRVAGLGLVGNLPFAKRRLMERAMGLGGDVPKFVTEPPFGEIG